MHAALQDYLYASLALSPRTQQWYRQKLVVFADWCEARGIDERNLKSMDVARFLDERRQAVDVRTGELVSTQTIRGYAQVVKSFMRWLAKRDEYEVPERWLKPEQIVLPRADQKIIQTFTREQIKRLMLAATQEYNRELQERDKAILRVLLGTGIRASELCGLTLERTHLDMHDPHIRVIGKGRREREIGLGLEARQQLYRYVSRWRRSPLPQTFLNRSGEPMTPNGLDQLLYRLRDWSGVSGVRVSAHTFRHTFAVEFLKQTGDLYRLKTLLGHGSVTTTQIYLGAFNSSEARIGMRVFDDL